MIQSRLDELHFDFRKRHVRFVNHSVRSQSAGTVPFSVPKERFTFTGVVRKNDVDLEQKINTLEVQYEIGIRNLSHVKPREFNILVDLLYENRDAFACADARIGLFPVEARIPTIPLLTPL